MAKVFQIKRGTTLKINFLPGAGTAGWHLTNWIPGVSVGGKTVQETFTAQIKQTTHDLLITELQKLDDVIAWVDTYRYDETYETPSWLHASMDAETGERRAWIRSITYEPLTDPLAVAGYAARNSGKFRVTIERGDWERDSHRDLPYGNPSAAASILYDYTAAGVAVGAHDVAGDIPARLVFEFTCASSDVTIDKIWCGIRSDNKLGASGDATNFANIWECEDGSNVGAGPTVADDAVTEVNTASPGGGSGAYVHGTPSADDTWEKYFHIRLGDVTANYTDNFGAFTWLLRGKIEAGSTYEVQLRWGYTTMADADFVRGPIVEMTNTNWEYIDLGYHSLPMRDRQVLPPGAGSDEQYACIQVWAQRTVSGDDEKILFDCLCPIPVDEGFLFASGLGLTQNSDCWFGEGPQGRVAAIAYSSASAHKSPEFDSHNFRLPPGDGRMVIVYARSDQSVFTDLIAISEADSGEYYERWLCLRGSE